ncbi:MAG: hypothetical protein LBC19_16430 [Tannerella sp.]|nr:hypothetical protein [Tannerella sp.]
MLRYAFSFRKKKAQPIYFLWQGIRAVYPKFLRGDSAILSLRGEGDVNRNGNNGRVRSIVRYRINRINVM